MSDSWEILLGDIAACRACGLCQTRRNVVPGEGDPHAELMFIGEGPGADEDALGRPFVGAAGRLLDKMIAAMGYAREQVYIANIVKCRPPGNRVPLPEEAEACLPFLRRQVRLARPRVIVCLGATAARHCIDGSIRITRDRGTMIERKGFYMMPTYHPAALLRETARKREAWQDLQAVMKKLDEIHAKEAGR